MWRDEAATWQAVHRSVPEIWHLLGQADVVHGLYYLFMRGVFAVFGDSLLTLRLPSVVAMAGATSLVTLLGTRLADRWAGLAAGLAFALLPAVQQYAQEGRSYALVTAGAALTCWLLAVAIDNPHRPGLWGAYSIVVLTGALLNWFSLLLLPAHAVTIALSRLPRATAVRWAVASSAGTIGALPLVIASSAQSRQVAWIPPTRLSTLLGLLLTLLAGALCAWFARSKEDHRPLHNTHLQPTALALPLLSVPPLLLLAASLTHPVYLSRYILFSYIGLALLIGTACRALALRLRTPPRRLITVSTALAFLGLLPLELSLRSTAGRVDDVLCTAENVAAAQHRGDGVLFIPAARRDTDLVSPSAFTGLKDLALVRDPLTSGTLNGVEGSPPQIAAAMMTAHRILVVTDDQTPSAPTARDRTKLRVLKMHFALRSATSEHGRTVTVYEARTAAVPARSTATTPQRRKTAQVQPRQRRRGLQHP